ncbi:MAG: putative toxin-antitoxin system toxin component, PIN family [Candidatus Sumerlaeota bacterium]|nr:putative toxin-antitoxin system toxin component, PIN family [Candidatus Sumerlaeota bacterium]
MNIVLDTNALVAGLLTPSGTCGGIVRSLTSGDVTLCVDARILFEYEDVLRRPRFGIDAAKIDVLLDHIAGSAIQCPSSPLPLSLPDPDDKAFLEVALAGQDVCLVTGNLKHFPSRLRHGVSVLSPGQFIEYWEKRGASG